MLWSWLWWTIEHRMSSASQLDWNSAEYFLFAHCHHMIIYPRNTQAWTCPCMRTYFLIPNLGVSDPRCWVDYYLCSERFPTNTYDLKDGILPITFHAGIRGLAVVVPSPAQFKKKWQILASQGIIGSQVALRFWQSSWIPSGVAQNKEKYDISVWEQDTWRKTPPAYKERHEILMLRRLLSRLPAWRTTSMRSSSHFHPILGLAKGIPCFLVTKLEWL